MSFDADRQGLYLQVYRPLYFQLVDVLLHKSHFPSEEAFASWSSDDKEQFRIYRSTELSLITFYQTYNRIPVVVSAFVKS